MEKHANKVFIIGHRNPDSDSICSAIAYAYLKNAIDKNHLYIPARTGSLNAETKFILKHFDLETPVLIKNVYPRVSDIPLKTPVYIYPNEPIYKAAQLLREKKIRTLPVVNEHFHIVGVIGETDLARFFVDKITLAAPIMPIHIHTLVKALEGRVLANSQKKQVLKGRIVLAITQKGTILHYVRPGDVAIVGDRTDVALELINAGCEALILSENTDVSEEIFQLANKKGTVIISSPLSAYAIVQIVPLSLPVEAIMNKPETVVYLDTPISEVKKKILVSPYRSVLIADQEKRLVGIVTRSDLIRPIRKKVILVDHNDSNQAVLGIQEAEILEIIDHHHLGDISTFNPIYVYNDPVGSTCTIIAELMQMRQVEIPPEIAGALLGGILSDTLILNLSTTTDRDCRIASFLAKQAKVDIKEFGKSLIQVQADVIKGKTAREILFSDFREYSIGDKKIGVGQILVVDRKEISNLKPEIKKEMQRALEEQGFNMIAFTITCPFDEIGEEILVKGEKEIVEKAFGVSVINDECVVPHIMSRKKDFIPAIAQVLTQYEF